MRLPHDIVLKMGAVTIASGLSARPRVFFNVKMTSGETPGMEFNRFVAAFPLLLRLRLWFAVKRLAKTVEKYKKFSQNNPISLAPKPVPPQVPHQDLKHAESEAARKARKGRPNS